MGVIATAVSHLIAAGVTGDALVTAIADMEAELPKPETRSKAAIRQANYRERKASQSITNHNETSLVTVCDALPFPAPPNENNLTPPTHTPVYIPRAREAFPKLDCATPELWVDFLKNRKAKRLPCTASAHTKLCRDLERWSQETGWPPGEVFHRCVEKGWGAIYDPRDKELMNGSANRTGAKGSTNGFAKALRHIADGPFDEPFGTFDSAV